MQEIELRFQIPPDKREAILKALQRKSVQHTHTQNLYFDNEQFELFQRSILLKQHLENEQWLQILKSTSNHYTEHFEIKELLSSNDHKIQVEHYQKNKHIPKEIRKLISSLANPLSLQFSTNFERSSTLFNFQNSQIIVELDRGLMQVNQDQFEIYELRFQLKQGTIQDLISFILPRVKRYSLWLDIRSHVQQGFQYAQDEQEIPVQQQIPLHLNKNDSTEQALKKVIHHCLQHLLPNSTAIASQQFNSEHVHQARVAIRRLRSALKTFSGWSQHIDLTWQDELANLFRELGTSRDLSMFYEELLPQLEALDAPKFKLESLPQYENHKLSDLFKSLSFASLVLSLIQFVHQDIHEQSSKSIEKTIHKKLEQLHESIQLDAENYLSLDVEARHRTRKRLKRLRYSVEFISSLYDQSSVKTYLKALKPAQESLGKYNDLIVAENLLKPYVTNQPEVWFALGWIAAEKQNALMQSQQDLLHFAQVKTFWK